MLWSTEHALLIAGEALEGKPNATPGDNVLVYYESPGELTRRALCRPSRIIWTGRCVRNLSALARVCRFHGAERLCEDSGWQADCKATEEEAEGRGALHAC